MITLLNNHIDREENGLFPAALAYLDDSQWDTIQRPELMDNDDAPPAPTNTTTPTGTVLAANAPGQMTGRFR